MTRARRLDLRGYSRSSAALDILFALFRDQSRGTQGKHQEQQREYDDVDESRVHELCGEAFDEPDQQPGNDRALDIAEPADDHNGEGLDDYAGTSEGREH